MWAEAETVKQNWCTVHTHVRSTALTIYQCFYSTLNRVSKDHRSSSLSHRLNFVVPLAYTLPAQMKGIIVFLCGIHCNALGSSPWFCETTMLKSPRSHCFGIQNSILFCGCHNMDAAWISIWLCCNLVRALSSYNAPKLQVCSGIIFHLPSHRSLPAWQALMQRRQLHKVGSSLLPDRPLLSCW